MSWKLNVENGFTFSIWRFETKLTSQNFDWDLDCWFDFQPLKPRKQGSNDTQL